jgi:small conductance mechanosensitive channel
MQDWITDELNNLWDWISNVGVQILWAAVVIVAILFGSRWVRRRTKSAARRHHYNPNVVSLLDNITKVFIYTLVFIVVLKLFGVSSSSLVTVVGLVSAAITLSLQDVLKNFVSGLYLLAEQPFLVGDRIEVVGQKGVIERVDIRTTVLRDEADELVLVPNYKVFSEVVLNRKSHVDAPDRFTIEGAAMPLAEAKSTLTGIIAGQSGISKKEPKIEIVRASADTFDYEILIWWRPGESDRFALVSCLREHFPEAVIRRVTIEKTGPLAPK